MPRHQPINRRIEHAFSWLLPCGLNRGLSCMTVSAHLEVLTMFTQHLLTSLVQGVAAPPPCRRWKLPVRVPSVVFGLLRANSISVCYMYLFFIGVALVPWTVLSC
jgi:hypothetical protein